MTGQGGRAGVAAGLAALAAALAGCQGPTGPSPAPGPTRTAPAAPAIDTATMRRSVEAFLPAAERFVEGHRHLRYLGPVQVTALEDAAFRRRLEELPGDSPEDLEKATKELRALGLIQGQVDLKKLDDELLGNAVEGFYDSETKALVVRGRVLTPWVREVIVHELTHAVQDQNFNIHRPEVEKSPDEQSTGFHALLEGDALRIEDAYRATMSPDERRQADAEGAGSGPPPDVPRVLVEQLGFPYEVGPPFVEAVLRARGEAGLNAVFRTPPTTSSQVIHPERFLAGRGAVHVDPPPADGRVFDQGALGEENVIILLEGAVDAGRLSNSQAAEAASTWAGDWSTAWDSGATSCLRVQFVTLGSATPLRNALRAFAAGHRGITISAGGPITLTGCA